MRSKQLFTTFTTGFKLFTTVKNLVFMRVTAYCVVNVVNVVNILQIANIEKKVKNVFFM